MIILNGIFLGVYAQNTAPDPSDARLEMDAMAVAYGM